MKPTLLIPALALLVASCSATAAPCLSNTKGVIPTTQGCSAAKTSTAIQAAECSHNTRTGGKQTFAVFVTNHKYDSSHGAPYGTCTAYTCTPPANAQLKPDADAWVFYWTSAAAGNQTGVGTGCIKSPKDGSCGCENSNGEFIDGSSNCT